MGAGDRDAALQPHQFGQHFGAAHHRNALRARRHQFRIVALDRGRDHDHVGAVDVLGLVADDDRDALLAQPLDIGAFGGIRALHGVAEIAQHLGDAAHADAADPDEVDGSDLARQSHECVPVSLVMPGMPGASAMSALMQTWMRRDKPGFDAEH